MFVDTAAYGVAESPFQLARSVAASTTPPFDDVITLADSADAVVTAVIADRLRFQPTG